MPFIRSGAAASAALVLCLALIACKSAPPSRAAGASQPDSMDSTHLPAAADRPDRPDSPEPDAPRAKRQHKRQGRPGPERDPGRNPASAEPAHLPTSEELVDSALAKLKKGNLAYSTPATMKTSKTAHIVARIGSDGVSVETLQAGMPVDQGQTVSLAATPVSAKMKMTLKGADFDITPLSSEEQIVAGSTPTQWEWDIVPKHSGALRLHLAAVVELNDIAKDFTSIDRVIAVQVDPMNELTTFLRTNWQWLIATFVTASGAAWKYRSSRKKTTPA